MPSGVIGMEGFVNKVAGLSVTKNLVSRVDLPATFDLGKAATDCDVLAKFLREHPQDMQAILQACAKNDLVTASAAAKKIGFSEEAFVSAGGGLLHLILILVVAAGKILKWWN